MPDSCQDYTINHNEPFMKSAQTMGAFVFNLVTSTHTLVFYKGTGSKSLDFYWRLDNSQYYYVVLMYDGHIIAGKRW